jgi:cytochrome c peroxidase
MWSCASCHPNEGHPDISRTGPYFHDGRYPTLDQAGRAMCEYVQKAGTTERLSDEDQRNLVEFLTIL